ncbi:hypothetical protein [Xanthovirga aplysinae]|uniref:hypothetical protein n=1 Tax=Xanthovirga aplysinae TaxID=2529853 RepID=UPI0012BBBA03|nr:hypothetical protein [Xanthovirga aplysinae]MTI32492.1 hypothetical protein [Xanthovirga aplysinae]
MELKDLLITPLFLVIIYAVAYFIRPLVSDSLTQRYFFSALSLKLIGAIALGMIYQFYYGMGDTFTYFTNGSKYIWEAFLDSPFKAFKLIFLANGEHFSDTLEYSRNIWMYRDLPSYFVVRVAGFFDLFTFHTYSATACLFALFSFSGLWAMFRAFQAFFPMLHRELAIALFFIPSVFFWGSGIMKDTLTLGALAWATYAIVQLFFEKKRFFSSAFIFLSACVILYEVKIYILICFVPALVLWLFIFNLNQVKNKFIRYTTAPFVLSIAAGLAFFAVKKIGEDNKRYSLEQMTKTAEASARWLAYVSDVEGGSGYSLGDFDFSPPGMIRKFPRAVWVSLFQPHLWEVRNPVMLLSSLEGTVLLLLSFYLLWKIGLKAIWVQSLAHPEILFCFTFAIAFAFAIGIVTYNYGSLVRYKVPLIPYYLMGLFFLKYYYEKGLRKVNK